MRKLGHVLLWAGFLITALVAMRQSDTVSWPTYFGTAAIGVAGVVLLRRTAGTDSRQTHIIDADLKTLGDTISRVVEATARMNADKESINVYDVHQRIDDELAGDLAAFAEARESMIPAMGLTAYAEVMDPFARGERFVNRAWSASADGYIDEVWASMATAHTMLQQAKTQLDQHRA